MATMVLDIGGTAIKSALYKDGELIEVKSTPTEAIKGGAFVMETAVKIIASYKEKYEFDRIGISTAGQVNPVEGSIKYANQNIPGYTGTKVAAIMEENFHVPTRVENDVNAAAIGEANFGAGKGLKHFVCLTYGTGVGGAMFLDGKLYSGAGYSAGEFGALVIHPEESIITDDSSDFYAGCYEKYASTTGLVKKAMQVDERLSNGKLIFEAFERPEVKAVIDAWIDDIVLGLRTIIHLTNPEAVILGGGIMEQPYVIKEVRERTMKNIMPSFRDLRIVNAELGNTAGMLGAAAL